MFGRRKPKPHLSQLQTPESKTIIIDEAALAVGADEYAAVQSVVDYTNAVMHNSLFKVGEFPKEAHWIYIADYYVGQVLNGGHSQFLDNAGKIKVDGLIESALNGLRLVGFDQYASCLTDCMTWSLKNPEEAAAQNGFTNRADALDELDNRFFSFDKKLYYQSIARWLKSSPLVELVPSNRLELRLQRLKRDNPNYSQRMRVQQISALDGGVTTDTVAVFRACVAGTLTDDKHLEILSVLGGQPSPLIDRSSPDFDFTELEHQLWTLHTNSGRLFGQFFGNTVEIFVQTPETNTYEPLFERPRSEVEQQLELARHHPPGRYALALLNKFRPEESPLFLFLPTPRKPDLDFAPNGAFYGVSTDAGAQYLVLVHDNGAALFDWPDENPLGNIQGSEFMDLKAEEMKLV